ncbi:MAG: TfoX/Sxy family protein [Chloroflexota bacterium]
MTNLTDFPNIGETLAEKLEKIGITSQSALAELGSVETVMMIGKQNLTTCYNMLYAIEGAIQGIRWHAIPKEERALLKVEFDRRVGN